jgi:hypothetical protein
LNMLMLFFLRCLYGAVSWRERREATVQWRDAIPAELGEQAPVE